MRKRSGTGDRGEVHVPAGEADPPEQYGGMVHAADSPPSSSGDGHYFHLNAGAAGQGGHTHKQHRTPRDNLHDGEGVHAPRVCLFGKYGCAHACVCVTESYRERERGRERIRRERERRGREHFAVRSWGEGGNTSPLANRMDRRVARQREGGEWGQAEKRFSETDESDTKE